MRISYPHLSISLQCACQAPTHNQSAAHAPAAPSESNLPLFQVDYVFSCNLQVAQLAHLVALNRLNARPVAINALPKPVPLRLVVLLFLSAHLSILSDLLAQLALVAQERCFLLLLEVPLCLFVRPLLFNHAQEVVPLVFRVLGHHLFLVLELLDARFLEVQPHALPLLALQLCLLPGQLLLFLLRAQSSFLVNLGLPVAGALLQLAQLLSLELAFVSQATSFKRLGLLGLVLLALVLKDFHLQLFLFFAANCFQTDRLLVAGLNFNAELFNASCFFLTQFFILLFGLFDVEQQMLLFLIEYVLLPQALLLSLLDLVDDAESAFASSDSPFVFALLLRT